MAVEGEIGVLGPVAEVAVYQSRLEPEANNAGAEMPWQYVRVFGETTGAGEREETVTVMELLRLSHPLTV